MSSHFAQMFRDDDSQCGQHDDDQYTHTQHGNRNEQHEGVGGRSRRVDCDVERRAHATTLYQAVVATSLTSQARMARRARAGIRVDGFRAGA